MAATIFGTRSKQHMAASSLHEKLAELLLERRDRISWVRGIRVSKLYHSHGSHEELQVTFSLQEKDGAKVRGCFSPLSRFDLSWPQFQGSRS